MSKSALEQARRWTETVWGERNGYFSFAFGVGGHYNSSGRYQFEKWVERDGGRWPDDRERFLIEAIDKSAECDVYVAPYLRSSPSRKKGSALPSNIIFADVDEHRDENRGFERVLIGPGGLLVDSGHGQHPYLRLPGELEPAELEQWNRRLARLLHADAGWAENKVLRLPGTWNHKDRARGGRSTAVRLVEFKPALKNWTPAELAELLPELDVMADASVNGALVPRMPEKVPAQLLTRLNETPGDRSKQSYAFVAACLEAGLSDAETLAVALEHGPTKAKFGERAATEIERSINKQASEADDDPHLSEGSQQPSQSARPGRDAVGTRCASPSAEKGETAIASVRPYVVGTRDGTRSFSADSVSFDLRFVEAAVFAAVDEPGAAALVGTEDNVLVPEGGDVMFYGDGGAGKTTLMIDLALHLTAGDRWLGIGVGRPVRVGIVENEGPRALFRAKLRRKLRTWEGSALGDRLQLLEEPWSKVSVDVAEVREALAVQIAELELDALLVGPVTRSGMNEAGTLQQVRDYTNLLAEVRSASGRRVTFLLAHHENRGGSVSGAWEGAVDTLFHVQAQGNGQTRLLVQKARWSPEHHKQKLQLAWVAGEGFKVIDEEERDDNTVADEILEFVREHPGTGWNKVDEAVAGKGDRLRAIRDNLLSGRRLVNRGSQARMKLWHGDDPALPTQELQP